MTIRKSAWRLAAAALVALTVPAAAADETAIQSLWAAGPMTIDGIAQEWDESTPIVDDGSKVEYALRNDGQNLYIIMVFRSPQPGTRAVSPKSTLDYTGMRIYFTTGPKKSKDFGILFQKKQYTAEALIASMEKQGRPLTDAQKAEIRQKPTHIVFTEEIIKPKKAAAPAAADAEPPIFRSIEKGPLAVCEFRIPLTRIGAGPGQTFKLGFEWGGMTNQIMRDMMSGRADQNVAAGERGGTSDRGFRDESGEGGVGGTRPGEIPRSEFNRDPRFQKHSFWIDAKLASSGD
jgi:hypothetical protein